LRKIKPWRTFYDEMSLTGLLTRGHCGNKTMMLTKAQTWNSTATMAVILIVCSIPIGTESITLTLILL